MNIRILFIISHLICVLANAQQEPKLDFKERSTLLIEFIYAQDTALNWIKENRTDLRLSAIDAQQDFRRMFSNAIYKNLPLAHFEINPTNIEIIHDTLEVYLKDTSNHRKFISLVVSRSKGLIESPILETLLYFEYLGSPEREISDGFYNTYSAYVNNRTELIYRVPKSWREDDLPTDKHYGLMARYSSNYGDGNETIYISMGIVKADTTIYRNKMFQKLNYSKKMAKHIISGSQCAMLIDHDDAEIGNLKGHRFKHKKCETIGEQFQYAMDLSYGWAYQNYNFLITYSVIDVTCDDFLEYHYDEYRNLFTKLAGSLRVSVK